MPHPAVGGLEDFQRIYPEATMDSTDSTSGRRGPSSAEERYRLLVDSVREYAIITLEDDGLISTWNVGAERLFGYTENEAVGRPGAIIFTEGDRRKGAPAEEMSTAAKTGQAADERWHVRKDGTRFWGTGVMTALYLPDGELRGFAKVMRDNTERKRSEETLRELADTLEERVERRTRQVRKLASTLTMAEQQERSRISRILHTDLQQILYSIQMKLAMLRDGPGLDAAGAADALEEIERWVESALVTTRRLTVDLSPPVLEEEGLADALAWLRSLMHDLYGFEVRIDANDRFFIDDESWRVLLFQVVRELLFNVVKHAGTDHALVQLEAIDGELLIRVSDEGSGFDLEEATARRSGQAGIGLFSVRERLELFGGRLDIDSAPGQGSRITLYAPLEPRPGPAGGEIDGDSGGEIRGS